MVAGIEAYAYSQKVAIEEPLKILLKDRRLDLSEAKLLSIQPTVVEVQLQREDGTWVKIWEGSEFPIVKPNEPAILLTEVHVEDGTYIGSKIKIPRVVLRRDP